ncbi:MAG: alpha-L-rhamnosidase C-terminal domain-containing protein [Bryobacteraceae bacterium]
MYQCVAGIDTTTGGPGFHEITSHPRLDPRVDESHGQYESAYGRITTDWSGTASGPFSLKVSIPANTTARVFLPAIPGAKVNRTGRSSGHASSSEVMLSRSVQDLMSLK